MRQMRLLFSLFELSSKEKFTKDVLNQVTGLLPWPRDPERFPELLLPGNPSQSLV